MSKFSKKLLNAIDEARTIVRMENQMNDVSPNLNGPEAIPLREFIKDLPMMVCVYDGDKLIRSEEINYGNREHRIWLGKVTYWSISNNYIVETSKP